jgi:type IV pilus assembly protein PilC
MMTVYEYTAIDEKGSKYSGVYEDVDSAGMLREELCKMGDTLVKAKRKKTPSTKLTNIRQSEIVTFAHEFAGMCSAGLSIVKSLETLEQQHKNPAFKHIISDIRERIERGMTLKKAFEKYRDAFSDFFLGMIEAGESGGKLSQTLEMSASYLEKQVDLKRKIKSAFAYPAAVTVMCFVIVTCLLIFVIPVFRKIYQQLHVSLPGPTQTLVNLSMLISHWWWAIILVVVTLFFGLRHFLKSPYLKEPWDAFKLNMPVLGNLNRMVVISRFIRTFAMLASAGVSLVKALDIASAVANNSKVRQIAGDLQQSIEAGSSLAGSLEEYDIFPPMIIQLAACGEEAGMLSEMLNKGVDFLDKDIDRTINMLLIKLEPALTVIMGTIVGFILIGVYLPMFDYMSHLK